MTDLQFTIEYQRICPKLRSYLLYRGADLEQVDDLVSETFMKVWQFGDTFRGETAAFSTWVFRIGINLLYSRYRREKNAPVFTPLNNWDGPAPNPLSETPSVDEILSHPRISKKAGTALRMRFIEGLKYTDISQMTGESLGTLKSRCNQALQTLRNEYVSN